MRPNLHLFNVRMFYSNVHRTTQQSDLDNSNDGRDCSPTTTTETPTTTPLLPRLDEVLVMPAPLVSPLPVAAFAQPPLPTVANHAKRLHVSNIPFRFREPDLRQLFGVSTHQKTIDTVAARDRRDTVNRLKSGRKRTSAM